MAADPSDRVEAPGDAAVRGAEQTEQEGEGEAGAARASPGGRAFGEAGASHGFDDVRFRRDDDDNGGGGDGRRAGGVGVGGEGGEGPERRSDGVRAGTLPEQEVEVRLFHA